MAKLAAVILAAGEGKRMHSNLAKVLHPICGRPMIQYVVEYAQIAPVIRTIVVVGYNGEQVKQTLQGWPVEFVEQTRRLGTGHAVAQAQRVLAGFSGEVLVLSGDTPLVHQQTLRDLVTGHRQNNAAATVLTAVYDDPTGLGRIVRDQGGWLERIVEERDATPQEKIITEVNTGTYCFAGPLLFTALRLVRPENAQNEYYLTDTIAILKGQGHRVAAMQAGCADETRGINTPEQLAKAETIMAQRLELDPASRPAPAP